MMDVASKFNPVVVVIPEKKPGSTCMRPLVINGLTFDLSNPTRVIRLAKESSSSDSNTVAKSHSNTIVSSHSSTFHSNTSKTHTQTTPSSNPVSICHPADLSTEQCTPHYIDTSASIPSQSPPVSVVPSSESGGKSSSHKEVERRRKLKISTCIQQLSECLPFQILGKVSHGVVLEKVIEHIEKLKKENENMNSKTSSHSVECELKYVRANLLLENILLKELYNQIKRDHSEEDVSMTEEPSSRSHDCIEKSPDTSLDSPDTSHDSVHNENAQSVVTSEMRTEVSTSKTPNHDYHPTTCSPTHQTWPVTSLLSGTQDTAVVSSHPPLSAHTPSRSLFGGLSESSNVITNPTTSPPQVTSSIQHDNSVQYNVQATTQALLTTISSSLHCSVFQATTNSTSGSIVQPWVDQRKTLTTNHQRQAYTFRPFQNTESASLSRPHPPHISRDDQGCHRNSLIGHHYYSSPAPSGGSLVSSSHVHPTHTLGGLGNTTTTRLSTGDYLQTNMQSRSQTLQRQSESHFTRYKPYPNQTSRKRDRRDLPVDQTFNHNMHCLPVHSGHYVEQEECPTHPSFQLPSIGTQDSHELRRYSMEYTEQRYTGYPLPQSVSHDNSVMSYDTTTTPPYVESQGQPSHGSVWRPYSEPHRLSGFGLSDILSHSHSEGGNQSLHLEPTPPTHVNRMHSFLVDSLLDDNII